MFSLCQNSVQRASHLAAAIVGGFLVLSNVSKVQLEIITSILQVIFAQALWKLVNTATYLPLEHTLVITDSRG